MRADRRHVHLRVQAGSLETRYKHSTDFEEMTEAMDLTAAAATYAAIADLPELCFSAIHAWYLDELWTSNLLITPYYEQARDLVGAGLQRRGIL